MHQQSRLFRLSATVAMAALLGNSIVPVTAMAQPAPPPGGAQPDQSQGDPPARVGRLANVSGTVSFRTSSDTQWSPASANYPVSSGNAFWADNNSAARLEISDSRVALAPLTEFDVNTLDDSGLQGTVAQGEIYMHLVNLAPNEVWTLQTPRGAVRIAQPGRYDIVVGSTDAPTLIIVVEGSAQIEGPGVSLTVNANQMATINGTDTFQGSVGPATRDTFLNDQLNAERPPPSVASLPPQVATQVAAMPGGADLYQTGQWSQAPDYGQVWYPPVSQGWVPYREGHWAYVAPWGWTWVDNASWGFAPFHYGRWVQVGSRWGWTPGVVAVSGPEVYSPVYAPALVAFVGLAAGVAIGAALANGNIGWVPLGAREPFHPWYHASDSYFRQVNGPHVTNINNVTNVRNTTVNNITVNNFANRSAATVVPASVMTGSRPVQSAVQHVDPRQWAAARPITGQVPVRPISSTSGVTPAVARQLNLAPAAPGSVRAAPGPEVRPAVAAGAAGGRQALPALVSTHPGQPATTAGVPGAGAPHLPGQPTPGAEHAPGAVTPDANHNAAAVAAPHLPGQPAPGGDHPPGAVTPDANHNAAAVAAPHLPGQPTPGADHTPGAATPEANHAAAAAAPHLPGQPAAGADHTPGAVTPEANHAAAVAAPHLPGQPTPGADHTPGAVTPEANHAPAVATPHLPGQPTPGADHPPAAMTPEANHAAAVAAPHLANPATVGAQHAVGPAAVTQAPHMAAPVEAPHLAPAVAQQHVAPPAAQIHTAPAPQIHAAPPPQAQAFHPPAPQAHIAPQPQPQAFHAPAPQVHVAPQPQAFHPPAPQAHAAPPPAPHPAPPPPQHAAQQQQHEKRPPGG
jgi:hypothetical protein